MVKIISLIFALTMTGTVDQVNGRAVTVEILAKDGHTHEETLPLWMFPCQIKEGSKFLIAIKNDSVSIVCKNSL